jgi:activator of 2-hydroxyglutaryl-CoA dehydratase
MAKRVGIEEKVGLIGGAVLNKGLVQSLKDSLGMDATVLPDPQYVSALGVALMASKA